jgi:hypothetical protein
MIAGGSKAKNLNSRTRACGDHGRDLVHELSDRFHALARYDQYIADAAGRPKLQEFWRGLKKQDEKTLRLLRELIEEEVRNGSF